MLQGIHWVIVGGENGLRARPPKPEWALKIGEQSENHNVPFFFKQWGTYDAWSKRVCKKAAARMLDGKTWDDMPAASGPGCLFP